MCMRLLHREYTRIDCVDTLLHLRRNEDAALAMATYRPNESRDVLVGKSRLAQAMRNAPRPQDILIIDDIVVQSTRLAAMVRGVFGFETKVRVANSLQAGLQAVLASMPDLILLDDVLRPTDTAMSSLPKLRQAGCTGCMVVISAEVETRRSAELIKLGAVDVVHRDDLNGARISQAWLKCCGISEDQPDAGN